jgi:hypothetical protein
MWNTLIRNNEIIFQDRLDTIKNKQPFDIDRILKLPPPPRINKLSLTQPTGKYSRVVVIRCEDETEACRPDRKNREAARKCQ